MIVGEIMIVRPWFEPCIPPKNSSRRRWGDGFEVAGNATLDLTCSQLRVPNGDLSSNNTTSFVLGGDPQSRYGRHRDQGSLVQSGHLIRDWDHPQVCEHVGLSVGGGLRSPSRTPPDRPFTVSHRHRSIATPMGRPQKRDKIW